MRPGVFRVDGSSASPVRGRVVWAPLKSIWITVCCLGFVIGVWFATTWSAVLMFLVLTYATLLLGHSLGRYCQVNWASLVESMDEHIQTPPVSA